MKRLPMPPGLQEKDRREYEQRFKYNIKLLQFGVIAVFVFIILLLGLIIYKRMN